MSEKLHIIPHKHRINRRMRNEMKGHSSLVIWFTGFSGSGKSTLANALEEALYEQGYHTFVLDGDNVRKGLNSDLDFSDGSRKENIRRIGEVTKLMADAGLVVMSAFISPFREDRERVRKIAGEGNFIEVFVDCPIEVCEQRDTKGLYAKARRGEISNFTGISAPFEAPESPDIHIQSDKEPLDVSVQKLISYIQPKLNLSNE
ncbi:adenylylsulfate kinase [Pontibacter ummariensis]|uniref:Adenylyl-sulfate kinase n=1 Tax=Pontibacter ummariensis TaxID=1610492 RepID=A0A239EIZ8_9BACT|nr:adenylyl-sulfate kinase [Pontibacter ummariensis]PRY13283.1 adenylylsulfate kinase [Pontibacter ummariensis]SNS44539.1 adenylylsulfate kinase [Pontibacter ummariensis]